MMEEELGDRYRHLLQPIRDISQNWDLSIKQHLDEYLEKLKNVRERNAVREDGETVRFNFSEAAMLLQGSLQIFARKVDHLYEAIVEAYMGISNKKRKKKQSALDQTLNTTGDSECIHRIKNDFALIDEKAKMLEQMVDTRWFLQNDRRREPREPVRVGNRRDVGRRDRFVDLPISFIPTKKSAPSIHHFRFEQNNEFIYVPQSDLFSFNAIAFSNDDGSDMTVFVNKAYLDLVHSFSPEYIPYLRDENNRRLQRIGDPYDLQASAEVYARLIELDERENRGNTSQRFLDTFYAANGGESPEAANVVDLTIDLDQGHIQRPSFIEEARESAVSTDKNIESTVVRESNIPAGDIIAKDGLAETSFVSKAETDNSVLHSPRRLDLNTSIASSTQTKAGHSLDIDEELEFLDEYAEVKAKLRKDVNSKDKKKKKYITRRAEDLCRVRDERIREKFLEQGKDYEKYKNNLSEYINARLFSRRLCTFGSVLENLNPSLRSRHIQALNRVFYVQEKYERAVKAQRKQQKLELERAQKKEEKLRKRQLEQIRLENIKAKRRRLTNATVAEENVAASLPLHPADIPNPSTNNENVEPEDDVDYFGAQPDDEDDLLMPNSADEEEDEYNPARLMEREIEEMGGEFDDDEELPEEVNIFTQDDAAGNDLQTQDVVLGDNADWNFTTNDLQNTLGELGTFATNDPSFFDLNRLAEVFNKANFDLLTDDQILLHSIQNFWAVIQERDITAPRQRLQQWSAHILERLDEDTRHKPFQIHDYGSTVIELFGENAVGKTLKFKQIVKGIAKYEVSRYLLATLILANYGNVEIINEDEKWDEFGQPVINNQTVIKLLSADVRQVVNIL